MKRPFDINWPEKRPGFLESACILSQLNSGKNMNSEFKSWLNNESLNVAGVGKIEPTDEMINLMELAWNASRLTKRSEISRDNEIKMQMATKMYCALLTGDRIIDGVTEEKVVDSFCEAAEQIFNRFNK